MLPPLRGCDFLVTRRVSEGEAAIYFALAYASGYIGSSECLQLISHSLYGAKVSASVKRISKTLPHSETLLTRNKVPVACLSLIVDTE